MTAWSLEEQKAAANWMADAILRAGFTLSGPTDSRVAEHGEPPWVCEARLLIARWSAQEPAREPCPRLVREIASRVEEEGHIEELADRVHDCFASRASDVNNAGASAIVSFLLSEGFSEKDILADAFVEASAATP